MTRQMPKKSVPPTRADLQRVKKWTRRSPYLSRRPRHWGMTPVSSWPGSRLPTISGTMMFLSSHSQMASRGSGVSVAAMREEKRRKHLRPKDGSLDTPAPLCHTLGMTTITSELGKKYKDKLTPFEGVATSRTEHLFEPPLVGLQASSCEAGEPVKTVFLTEARLVPAVPE